MVQSNLCIESWSETAEEIDSAITSIEKMQTVIHEGGHGLIHRLGFGDNIDPLLEEVWVDTFATFVVENFELRPKWTLKRR